MKILLDTSVLVAAIVEAHPKHGMALPWLQNIKNGTYEGVVSAHSLAELYAILTTLPLQPRISPGLAQQLIQQNVLAVCQVVSYSSEDYMAVVKHLAEDGLIGGIMYDALIVYTAFKIHIDWILTLNKKDFVRIYSVLIEKIISPEENIIST